MRSRSLFDKAFHKACHAALRSSVEITHAYQLDGIAKVENVGFMAWLGQKYEDIHQATTAIYAKLHEAEMDALNMRRELGKSNFNLIGDSSATVTLATHVEEVRRQVAAQRQVPTARIMIHFIPPDEADLCQDPILVVPDGAESIFDFLGAYFGEANRSPSDPVGYALEHAVFWVTVMNPPAPINSGKGHSSSTDGDGPTAAEVLAQAELAVLLAGAPEQENDRLARTLAQLVTFVDKKSPGGFLPVNVGVQPASASMAVALTLADGFDDPKLGTGQYYPLVTAECSEEVSVISVDVPSQDAANPGLVTRTYHVYDYHQALAAVKERIVEDIEHFDPGIIAEYSIIPGLPTEMVEAWQTSFKHRQSLVELISPNLDKAAEHFGAYMGLEICGFGLVKEHEVNGVQYYVVLDGQHGQFGAALENYVDLVRRFNVETAAAAKIQQWWRRHELDITDATNRRFDWWALKQMERIGYVFEDSEPELQVFVNTADGTKVVNLSPDALVGDLYACVPGLDPDTSYILGATSVIPDDQTLKAAGVTQHTTLEVMVKGLGGAPPKGKAKEKAKRPAEKMKCKKITAEEVDLKKKNLKFIMAAIQRIEGGDLKRSDKEVTKYAKQVISLERATKARQEKKAKKELEETKKELEETTSWYDLHCPAAKAKAAADVEYLTPPADSDSDDEDSFPESAATAVGPITVEGFISTLDLSALSIVK